MVLLSLIAGLGLCAPALHAQQAEAPGAAATPPPSAVDADSSVPAATPAPAQGAPNVPVAPAAAPDSAALPTPAAQTAAPAAPALPAQPEAVSRSVPRDVHNAVRFMENDGRHVTLFERKGEQWLKICTSPCYFTASDGPRDYAAPIKLGPATAGHRVAGKGLWLANGDGLQADFQDRSQIRKAGVGVLLAGLLTLAFLAPALDAKNETAAKAAVFSTSGVLTVSGLIMLLMKDRMQLTRCIGCNAGPRGL